MNNLSIDFHVDADLSRLWGYEYYNDTSRVQILTGYVILLSHSPAIRVSNIYRDTEIISMEVYYLDLCTSMHDLIPLFFI